MRGKGWAAIGAVFFVLLVMAGQAAADYLGPDRDYTYYVWERSTCAYGAVKADGSMCSLTLYYPPHECTAAENTAGFFNNAPTACGAAWGGTCGATFPCSISLTSDTVGSCAEGGNTEHSGTYPEAAISGALNGCTLQNGWCVTSPLLSLTANEPVPGYHILLIEGTRNGEAFACPGAACDVTLLEGQNDFAFWALSSWGDSSRMGSLTARVDTRPPIISGSLAGSGGNGNWFTSAVTLDASASDPAPGSGISALEYSLDGGAWTTYSGSLTFTEGNHMIDLR